MIAKNLRKSCLLSVSKSMAQIEGKKTLGLVITGIAGSIVLTLALCVLLASFVGFNQSEASGFNLFRETPLHNLGENHTYDLVWQSEPTSMNFAVTAILTVGGRVPVKYASNRCNHSVVHSLSTNSKFSNISPSHDTGGCGITFTSTCTYLLIDSPPPYTKA